MTFKGRSENEPYVYFSSNTQLPKHISESGLSLFDFFYGRTQQAGPSGLRQQIRFFRGRIPDTMIPIAGDGGAGQICIGIKGDDWGKVFYWDMANEPLDEETYLEDFGKPMPADDKRQNVYLVADSFDRFLAQLALSPKGD
ncbi:MAG: SMI1/KNR4 family protein [Planctomycetaceae bacterium]